MNDIVDLGMLSRALGFVLVTLRDKNLKSQGGAARAHQMAKLIEEFCAVSERDVMATATGAWSCDHQADRSVIRTADDVTIEVRGKDCVATRGAAERLMHAVNDNSRKDALIAEMSACLEMCLESETLSWEAEQDASILLARAKIKP